MTTDQAVPAALTLPYGHLFFGFPLVPRPNGATSELADAPEPASTFQGSGATLSGRMRPSQQAAASSSSPQKETDASKFSGQGNTLSKKREVIEID